MSNRAISVERLTKVFRARQKNPGLKASAKAIFKPEYKDIIAVDNVSFTVDEGEMLAFIGPNGAGKSTSIKMMTGILTPTGGEATVAGLSPVRERKRLAYRIGALFGQRSQLWTHLPPADSFDLLGALYDVPQDVLRARTDKLVERFGLQEFLHTPVRKLSLGQRVRCEIAASLLHEPQILFLDEPTIGLDVIVKAEIRELLLEWNKERGATILLTSHDAGDIERICNRVIVIDKGKVAYDQSVGEMKRRFLSRKVVRVAYAAPVRPLDLPCVSQKRKGDYELHVTLDTRAHSLSDTIQRLMAAGDVADIGIAEAPMEDIIASVFQGGEATA